MSILLVAKDEREALELEFAKLKEAGTLPGGVELGIPVELEDGSAMYVDSRWDEELPVKLAEIQADEKVAVSTLTKVVGAVPTTLVKTPIERVDL